VEGTKAQAAALDRAIRGLAFVPRPVTPARPDGRKVSAEAQREVLQAITRHANGAGFALLKVATIEHESGYGERTVQRVIPALVEQGHLERYRWMRSPGRYGVRVRPEARRGEGPSIFRVGASLRAAAGLKEADWTPEPEGHSQVPRTPPGHPQSDEPGELADEAVRVTPSESPGHPQQVQEHSASLTVSRVTPRTENGGKPLISEERLVLSGSEGTPDEDLPWHVLHRRVLEANGDEEDGEASLLSDCEALVAAGARWVGPCRYPSHRGSDWRNASGRLVCGRCHPPASRTAA
jgi:hypothetical protein